MLTTGPDLDLLLQLMVAMNAWLAAGMVLEMTA